MPHSRSPFLMASSACAISRASSSRSLRRAHSESFISSLRWLAYDMGYQLEPMKNAAEVEALKARLRELGVRA